MSERIWYMKFTRGLRFLVYDAGINGIRIVLPQFAGKRIVRAKSAIDLKIGFHLEFQLRPASHRIQPAKRRGRD